MFKALIVEDHAEFRRSLGLILAFHFPSWSLAEAANGRTALEQVRDFEPNLIFMDINLPDENGINLTKSIKAGKADITVIIVTAYDLPEYRRAALEAGASHFISKDVLSKGIVLQAVESAMTGSSLPMPGERHHLTSH
ncbi:transcriptional regulatory protein DegU [mine drainage metagenome]|uniref:Transcriptional regulatory protein DegU n=1 Tax=mine drainage metagenome TaxID=410659 RepID=A0A1J5T365_9ZZZZ